jgi:dihydrofolate reductase
MAKLVYAAIASLDGYVADADGNFDWSMPDEEVHAFVNDQQRRFGTQLYGRRLYDVMLAWETMETEGEPAVVADFAQVWRAADKIVYSRTLQAPSSARTRIEREFDVEAVRALKAAAEHDIAIGGAELAGQAIAAGLVDELQLLLSPIVVGGGTPALPAGVRWPLELAAERRFTNGVVYMQHRSAR